MALDLLVKNVDERIAMVERAQARLERVYGVSRLREQVLTAISKARRAAGSGRVDHRSEKDVRVCQVR